MKTKIQGFTITELLVAIALLSIISGLLLTAINQASSALSLSQQKNIRERTAIVALNIINRDFSQAIISKTPISTYGGPIHFYGFSTSAYFVSPVATEAESSLAQIALVFEAETGKLFRYFSNSTTNTWNPRDSTDTPSWSWGNINLSDFLYHNEANCLIAEGVVDIKFIYSGRENSTSQTWIEDTTWITTNSGTSTSFPTGYQTDTLPSIIDVIITIMPPSKWVKSTIPNYALITNEHARSYRATINVGTGGY